MSAKQNPPRDGEGDRAKRGGGGLRHPSTYRARKLRQEMTLPEVMLWQRLRGSQTGLKFRRQHRIGDLVADFYCPSARLVVEIDGFVHDTLGRATRDELRDASMHEKGFNVLRIPASDVLKDVDLVVGAIVARAAAPLRQSLRDCHLPMNGEDR